MKITYESIISHFPNDLTSDLRKAVNTRVKDTGFPSAGHGWPFILTQNWRDAENGT